MRLLVFTEEMRVKSADELCALIKDNDMSAEEYRLLLSELFVSIQVNCERALADRILDDAAVEIDEKLGFDG